MSLTVSNCMQASVGNSIATEGVVKKIIKNLIKFTFIFSWFTSMCTICLCCLYQPFVKIWMSGNKNLMLSDFNMFLFCTYFYVITSCNIRNLYISGSGLFWELRLSYFMGSSRKYNFKLCARLLFRSYGSFTCNNNYHCAV